MFSKTAQTVERRRVTRHRVLYRMDVSRHSKDFFGCLMDLSVSGMRVQCTEETDVLGVTKLRIDLPRWLELGECIHVEGRFVWCKGKNRSRIEAGFAFDTLPERERVQLEQVVERLALAAEEDGLPTE